MMESLMAENNNDEYPIQRGKPPAVHGNTKTGLPFHKLKVGDSFEVPPEDYRRTSSARAHFQKKQALEGKRVRISSGQVRDEHGRLKCYRFRRDV